MMFMDCNLIESLVDIVINGVTSSSDLAFHLLADILTISAKRLPFSYNDSVQSLPQLFAPSLDFQNESNRIVTKDKLLKIFKTHQSAIWTPIATTASRSIVSAEWPFEPWELNQDDYHFKQALNDSEVLGLKDHTKWNWNMISDLMKGSLVNPKRFDELVRNTKFASRLVNFIRPSSKLFSDTAADPGTLIIVSSCSKFIYSLLSTAPGYKFLQESKLIQEIVERLAKIGDPSNFEIDMCYSKDKIDTVLAKDYFTILGDIQKHPEAERVFEECKIWNVYYSLVDLRGKDFILRYILLTGYYDEDTHMRVIFSKLLTSGYKEMRLFTTNFILTLLERNTNGLEDWIPQMLVPQLFDPAPTVCAAALAIIQASPKYPEFMRQIILYKPNVDLLSTADSQVLISFAGTEEGFEYLLQDGFITKEAKYWIDCGIFQYSEMMDKYMTMDTVFDSKLKNSKLPLHLFGYLAQTKEGCKLIEKIDDFELMCKFLRNHLHESHVLKLKSYIWTLAHIGSSDYGFNYLKTLTPDYHILNTISDMSLTSPFFSIRGICIYSLCIFCKSSLSRELLQSLGWHLDDGICVPKNIKLTLKTNSWKFNGSWPAKRDCTFYTSKDLNLDKSEEEILKHIGNLSNPIIASANSKQVTALKQSNPTCFGSMKLLLQALRLTTNYQYKITLRRFIFDLFDKVVWNEDGFNVLEKHRSLNLVVPIVYKKFSPLRVEEESRGETRRSILGFKADGIIRKKGF